MPNFLIVLFFKKLYNIYAYNISYCTRPEFWEAYLNPNQFGPSWRKWNRPLKVWRLMRVFLGILGKEGPENDESITCMVFLGDTLMRGIKAHFDLTFTFGAKLNILWSIWSDDTYKVPCITFFSLCCPFNLSSPSGIFYGEINMTRRTSTGVKWFTGISG